jgi:hypothetical protein
VAIEGDSPVNKSDRPLVCIPSTAGYVESRRNPPGPSGKTKHGLMTDSELVPRGKGEKHRETGVKST